MSINQFSAGYQDRAHQSFISNKTDTKDRLNKMYFEISSLFKEKKYIAYGKIRLSKGIGGYDSIRGFNIAQESGEYGYSFSAEYLKDVPYFRKYNPDIKIGPFIDGGTVYRRTNSTLDDKNLYSAGITSYIYCENSVCR